MGTSGLCLQNSCTLPLLEHHSAVPESHGLCEVLKVAWMQPQLFQNPSICSLKSLFLPVADSHSSKPYQPPSQVHSCRRATLPTLLCWAMTAPRTVIPVRYRQGSKGGVRGIPTMIHKNSKCKTPQTGHLGSALLFPSKRV